MTTSSYNSDNFDLNNWYLTIPVDSSGGITGLAQNIMNLTSYASAYFYEATGGAMVFYAPVYGATTSSSYGARSELRELNPDNSFAGWHLSQGGTMTATLAVNSIPKFLDGTPGKEIIGQIHGKDDELVRLYYDNGTVYFKNDQSGANNTENKFLLTNAAGKTPDISLNEKFSYEIDAHASTLTVKVFADNDVYSSVTNINAVWQTDTLYFKAGVYLGVTKTPDVDVGQGTGSGQDSFYGLDFSHIAGQGLGGLASTALVNHAPLVQGDNFTGTANNTIVGNVLIDNGHGIDGDSDGDSIAVAAATVSSAHGGKAVLNADGSFIYTPKSGYVGTDSFAYTLKDGQGASSIGTVTIAVTALSAVTTDMSVNLAKTANSIVTGSGNDTLTGYISYLHPADVINTGAGKDTIHFLSQSTLLLGQFANITGVDVLDFSALTGERIVFSDHFVAQSDKGIVTVEYGAGTLLQLDASTLAANHSVILDGKGSAHLWDGVNNRVVISDTNTGHIYGGTGNDDITGGKGDDLLTGGGGQNTFHIAGGGGKDTITDFHAGKGGDVLALSGYTGTSSFSDLHFTQQGSDTLLSFGTEGSVLLKGIAPSSLTADNFLISAPASSAYAVNGTSGADTLNADHTHDSVVHGLGGNDMVMGHDGNDILYGDDGSDTLYGYWGNDTIIGGAGNDILNGSTGTDTLTGGAGNDVFKFGTADGSDIISDFHNLVGDKDTLDLSQLFSANGLGGETTATAISRGHLILTDHTDGVHVDFDSDGTATAHQVTHMATLTGVDLQHLDLAAIITHV